MRNPYSLRPSPVSYGRRPFCVFKHPCRCTWGTELFTECERPFAVFQTFSYDTFYTELRAFLTCTDDSDDYKRYVLQAKYIGEVDTIE